MIQLTEKQVITLHHDLVQATGGSDGLKDKDLLDSALHAPFQTYNGDSLFPTLFAKAARLGCGLVQNHPFVDGNKRTGAHTMLVFLELNGVALSYSQEELIDIFLRLASGKAHYDDLLQWILDHQLSEQ